MLPLKTYDDVRRERKRLSAIEPKRLLAVITDDQARRARVMKERGRSWDEIAGRLDVLVDELIRRCDRVLARKIGLRAPGWLYGYKQPYKRKRQQQPR